MTGNDVEKVKIFHIMEAAFVALSNIIPPPDQPWKRARYFDTRDKVKQIMDEYFDKIYDDKDGK